MEYETPAGKHWCYMRAEKVDGLYVWTCAGCGRIERH